jgi:tellurite methyltransferase
MADHTTGDPPSPFIVHWATALADRLPRPRRALDIAMGRGRHARVLAALGFRTFGVDRNASVVSDTVREAASLGQTIQGWCADLTVSPLPRAAFDLIVVARYLQRDLMESIREATTPAGIVVYETFTVNQRALGFGPKSPDHLLEPGELRASFHEFEVLFYEEVLQPEAVARLVARKGRIDSATD